MGMDPVTLGYMAVATLAAGTVVSADQQSRGRKVQRQGAEVQRAQNASEAARELRQQVREERIKRARILQSASNTGTAGSSGELGAISNISTNLGANLGANAGNINRANQISIFEQKAADLFSNAQLAQQLGSTVARATTFMR